MRYTSTLLWVVMAAGPAAGRGLRLLTTARRASAFTAPPRLYLPLVCSLLLVCSPFIYIVHPYMGNALIYATEGGGGGGHRACRHNNPSDLLGQ